MIGKNLSYQRHINMHKSRRYEDCDIFLQIGAQYLN